MIAAEPVTVLAQTLFDSPVVWHQVGPNPRPMTPSQLPIPRRRKAQESPAVSTPASPAAPLSPPPKAPTRYSLCLAEGEKDLAAGIAAARAWLGESQSGGAANPIRGAAALCLAQLLAQQGDYTGAQAAFAESAGQVPQSDLTAPAARDAYLGSVALAAGQYDMALTLLDKSLAARSAKAPTAEDNAARGSLQIDRSRALVALDRLSEAGGALEEAHRLAPNDPEGWLLSATLARRGKDLDRAQRDIEIAAGLAPHGGTPNSDPNSDLGPPIGLEAGVIAMLDGREEAARKSWESVLALAPESAEAKTARGYLDQLGPGPAPQANPPETAR
jgi:tetratricopeptide (TPR) repeat protein